MSYDLLNGKRIYQLDLQATLASDLKFAVDNEGLNEARYITLGQLSTLVGHPALSLGTPNGLHLIAGTQILSLELANTSHAGAIPTLPNDATKYLNGVGLWAVPATSGSVTPTDNILKWDTDSYKPYPNKLVTDPGYAYFYLGSTLPVSRYIFRNLNLNGNLIASTYFASFVGSTLSAEYSVGNLKIADSVTGGSIQLAYHTSSNTIQFVSSTPYTHGPNIHIGILPTGYGNQQWMLLSAADQLLTLHYTNIKLDFGTANRYLYLDSNKNITYVDAVGGGDYILPISTAAILGGVKIGSGVTVTADGTISVSTNYEPPITPAVSNAYYWNGLKGWTLFPTIITLASLSATAPLSYNSGTGVFSISQATTSTHGYLSSIDWNTFNNKVSFPGFGITHITAAYGDHTHSQYITGNVVTSFNTRYGAVTLTKADVEAVLTGTITSHTHTFSSGVTYIGMTVPIGLSVTPAAISTTGTFALTFTSGYSIPTNTNQTNWNTAYSWGNHAGLYDKYTGWTLTADGVTSTIYGTTSTLNYKGVEFVAGTNITIVGDSNALTKQARLTISATGGASGVTSVGLALPSSVFTITNSPVTTTGTLTGAFISQNAGKVFAASSTSDGIPAFRALDINHLPTGITATTVAFGNHLHTGVYSLAAHTHTLASLSDVTITTIAANEILKWNGTRWINNTLSEAGISAVGHIHTYDNYVSWELQVAGDSFDVTSGNYVNFGSGVRGALLTWDATYHRVEVSALRWYDVAPRQYSATSTITTTSDGFSVYLDDAGVYEIEVVLDAQVSNNTGGAKFNIYSSMTSTFVGHVMGVATSNSVTSYKIDSLSATYGLFLLDANGKGQIIIKGVYTTTTGGHAIAVLFQKVGSGTIYINAGSFIRAVKIS